MTHRLTTKCAKNYCNRTLTVKVIVENVVTCFFGTQCKHVAVIVSTCIAVSSMNEMDDESLVETDSPDGATASADGDNSHHRLRRMFSASVLGSLLGTLRLAVHWHI